MTKNENNIEEILQETIEIPKSRLGFNNYNNSHFFMCPLFDVKGVLKYKEYVNSYIEDDGRKTIVDCPLYCLFKFSDLGSEIFESINKYFFSCSNFMFTYYAGNNNEDKLIVYVLKAKEEDKQDYKHIINGRYSRVSDEYKKKYRTFGFPKATVKFIDNIVNKDKDFKILMEKLLKVDIDDKAELWNIFEPEREVFRYAT